MDKKLELDNKNKEKEIMIAQSVQTLTHRIPQPVGKKAKMQANMSGIDSFVNATATAKPASASKNETP